MSFMPDERKYQNCCEHEPPLKWSCLPSMKHWNEWIANAFVWQLHTTFYHNNFCSSFTLYTSICINLYIELNAIISRQYYSLEDEFQNLSFQIIEPIFSLLLDGRKWIPKYWMSIERCFNELYAFVETLHSSKMSIESIQIPLRSFFLYFSSIESYKQLHITLNEIES